MTDILPRTFTSIVVLILFGAIGEACIPTSAVAVTDVTSCGQTLSGDGRLVADLDCSSYAGSAVVIDGGSLDLQGFRLTGDVGTPRTVECIANCSITSTPAGGVIDHSVGTPTVYTGAPSVTLSNVVVETGIVAGGSVKAEDCTLDHVSAHQVRLERVTVNSTSSNAVDAGKARVFDSLIASTAAGDCLYAASAKVERTTIGPCVGAGIFIWGKGARVTASSISGTGNEGIKTDWTSSKLRVFDTEISAGAASGIRASNTCLVRDSDIHDNASHGVDCYRSVVVVKSNVADNGLHGIVLTYLNGEGVRVRESNITGNGTAAECGVSVTCADIASPVLPRMLGASCATSYDTSSGFPGSSWDICSSD